MVEWDPAVEHAARSRLGAAEADAFLARLEVLSPDILEPLGLVYGTVTDTGQLAAQLVLDTLAAAAARPEPLRRLDRRREIDPAWFQRAGMIGYVCYADRFAGSLAGIQGAPGLPGRAGRHLPAPDAAAAAPRGGERRRLRGGRLRRRRPARRHHGRPAGPGRRPARARHRAVRQRGPQPHRPGARVGPQGPGRRARLPRDVPDLPGPHRTRPVRAHPARGVPRPRAGQLHPRPRAGLGVDQLPRLPVGPELGQPRHLPGHAGRHAGPGQPRHRRAAA